MTTDIGRRLRLVVPIETLVETVAADDTADDTDDHTADELANVVVRAVSTDRAASTVETLHHWKFERAHGHAIGDVVGVVAAIRSRQVRLLLIADDVDDHRQVWIGEKPCELAIDLADAAATVGSVELKPVRLVDGLIRSAILLGIPVKVVPSLPASTLPGGVGVLIDPDATR